MPATDSLLWKHLDTSAFRRTLPRAVGLQVLHPAVAASLTEHVHTSLWGHETRSVEALIRLAYADRDISTTIRFAHEHVKGVDDTGARYHALNPELFHFAHATYVEALFTSIAVYGKGLTAAQEERLYVECCQWYERYGISPRAVPATWAEFGDYFQDACAGLRLTPAAARFRREVLHPPFWSIARTPAFAARALQHERAVELFGVTLSVAESRRWRMHVAARRLRGS